MSDIKAPTDVVPIEDRPTTDIVGDDQTKLQQYIEEGMPGIGGPTLEEVDKMFDLYLDGKTYTQISGIMRQPRVVVLCLSNRSKWFEIKQTYLVDMETNMKQRIFDDKILSQNFMLDLLQMMRKKIGAKMKKYSASGNEEFTNQINLKEVDRYLKIAELLQKSVALPSEKVPLIGLNVGSGATITRNGNNEIEVTPKDTAKANMLKYYADLNREKQKK